MTALYIGIILFGGSHLFSILLPAQRDALKARLGEKPFKGIYSAAGLVGLGFMIRGFLQSRSGPLAADWLYVPYDAARHITLLFVLLAMILLVASGTRGHIKAWVHNPMSLGIALWAAGHLLSNGKRADVYLFGTFLVVAVLDIVFSEMRGKRPSYKPELRSDVIAVIAGMVLYVIFLFGFHPYVLNLPVVQ